MKFNNLFYFLIESFNLYLRAQNAIQNGPDIGITAGQPTNTFPSRIDTLKVKLPTAKELKTAKKRRSKLSPKEK